MTTRRTLSGLLCVLAASACVAAPADAEWAIDLYGGAAWLDRADLRVKGTDSTGAAVDATIADVKTDTGFTAGIRGGYWFEGFPYLGVGLDAFYLSVEVPGQTTTATGSFTGKFGGEPISVGAGGVVRIPSVTFPSAGFSPELRLRWPLMVSESYPKGRFQPYIIAGPAWAFTWKGDEIDVVPGGKVAGGASFLIARSVALFGEYRFAFFPDFKVTDDNLTYKADINNHNLIVGVSFRF